MTKSVKLKNRFFVLLNEKERLLGRRIPQSEVANEIGVTKNTITNWVKNDLDKLDVEVVEKLCVYFDCQVGDLLYLEAIGEEEQE
jgi:putative transcriptional regulator